MRKRDTTPPKTSLKQAWEAARRQRGASADAAAPRPGDALPDTSPSAMADADTPPAAAAHQAADQAGIPPRPADDGDLFRAAIGPVREFQPPAPLPSTPRPRPAAHMAQRDEDQALGEFQRAMGIDQWAAGDALAFRRDHLAPKLLADLRRGRFAAQDEVDLHGLDASSAESLLRDFLRHAREQGHGCVRIIHGKGLNSPTGVPIIKNLVDRVLRHRSEVLAFHSAPGAQGGTGAVLVLLKR